MAGCKDPSLAHHQPAHLPKRRVRHGWRWPYNFMEIETVKNIRIRKGEPRDIETMVTFLHHLFALEKDFAIDADKNRAGLQLLLDDQRVRKIFVAETAGKVVGMVTAQIVVSTSSGGYSLLLEDMYVDSGFRRKAIGTKLLKQVLVWGSGQGADRVQLVADVTNIGALMFYWQAGLLTSRMTALYGTLDAINKKIT
ncbi:MAG: GNAT family N-acetyltransferase [Smithella sp.]